MKTHRSFGSLRGAITALFATRKAMPAEMSSPIAPATDDPAGITEAITQHLAQCPPDAQLRIYAYTLALAFRLRPNVYIHNDTNPLGWPPAKTGTEMMEFVLDALADERPNSLC